ncbi:hypothetical protein SAMN04488029_1233 [Reichenbachiella faecimaris]|uniref:3-keto-disaccharide hydrolase domain-containing protein n=1 Tax=Reichenbachiella faecimaris TaxID=692418 RepID=A0A1W2G8B4_REIFA|nr:hypothetical protein [Reichenbachiella faecimaris]SMD32873.1 hypothetical protein SAMN04488029_1233 [Reichenbachiella faecimaris]
MKKAILVLLIINALFTQSNAQEILPIDTSTWDFQGRGYVIEEFKGKKAVYLIGAMALKDTKFLNGTIEYDIFLKEERCYPGVYFRLAEEKNGEQFFMRLHLSGLEDATQAAPLVNNLTPWQLMFGKRYSFPYTFNYNGWTHVKVVVNGKKAQVYLDYATTPQLSWDLTMPVEAGDILLRGGRVTGLHIADIKIDPSATEIKDFNPIKREPLEGLVPSWEVSDMFEEKLLEDPSNLQSVIEARKWGRSVTVEEGTAANISKVQDLYNGEPGETVFAKITIQSDKDQIKLFEFGYSDRVVTILNGKAIYRGTNFWRSRDYRYLGTVGLFDGVYLDLKKGKNTLLLAVSESFGGWLVTGRIKDMDGIRIK